MTAPGRQADPEPRTYVTEIWCPPADDGIQRLHSPMPEPEPDPAFPGGQPQDRITVSAEHEIVLANPGPEPELEAG
jgi:hypothetical protein